MNIFSDHFEKVLQISQRTGLSIEFVSREISRAHNFDEIVQDLNHPDGTPRFRRKQHASK